MKLTRDQIKAMAESGHKNLTSKPICELNRNLHDRLRAKGFLNVSIDFEAVDAAGDFVVDPTLPVNTLVRSSVSMKDGGHTPMCIFGIDRGIEIKEWFKIEENWIFDELLEALNGSLDKQRKTRKLQLASESDDNYTGEPTA